MSSSLRSKVITGFFWLAATKAFAQALTWLMTLVVVRVLSPNDYGLMGIALLVNSFLLLFNELGLGAALIQSSDLTDADASDLRWVVLIVNVGLFGIVLTGAPAVAEYFHESALVGIVRALGAAFVINGVGAPSGFMLIRQMAFRKKAEAEFAGSLGGGIATLAFAIAGSGVWSLVIGYLLLHTITNALYCVYAPIALRPIHSARRIRRSLHFGSQVALGKVLWWISSSADSVIVGRMLGTLQVGYYGLAVQFASMPLQKIVGLITQVALPSFAALQHDGDTLRRYYLKLVGTVAFITFPMFLGLFVVSDFAVPVILTEKWAPIVLPVQLLALASCLRAIETLNTPLLIAKGRPGIPLFNSLLQALVLPIAFLVGTRWGVSGVAVGWLVVWPFLFAIVTGQTLRVLEIPVFTYLASLRHSVFGGLMLMLAVVSVRPFTQAQRPGASLLVMCVSGGMAYVGYYATFDRQTLRAVIGTLQVGRATPSRTSATLDGSLSTSGADRSAVTVHDTL